MHLSFPDEPFQNFGDLKSVAWRSWTAYSLFIRGFWGSKIVKGLVGMAFRSHLNYELSLKKFCEAIVKIRVNRIKLKWLA